MTAIHETRKDLKKVRSLLRLARPCLPDDAYRRTNARLRAIARVLAGTRDDDVLIEVADALAERHAGVLPASAFEALSARLAANAAARRAGAGGAKRDATTRELEAADADVERWLLRRCDADALGRGTLRAYRRGRAAMRRAEREPITEHLHEWRKRVKDLWYDARLLDEA